MADELTTNKNKYLDLTHKLNDYNEIDNLNNILLTVTNVEKTKLTDMDNNVRSRLLKMKQEYLLKEASIQKYNFIINMLYFTIVIFSAVFFALAAFVQDMIGKGVTIAIVIALSIVYLIVVLVAVRINANRRSSAWNQFYWQKIKK